MMSAVAAADVAGCELCSHTGISTVFLCTFEVPAAPNFCCCASVACSLFMALIALPRSSSLSQLTVFVWSLVWCFCVCQFVWLPAWLTIYSGVVVSCSFSGIALTATVFQFSIQFCFLFKLAHTMVEELYGGDGGKLINNYWRRVWVSLKFVCTFWWGRTLLFWTSISATAATLNRFPLSSAPSSTPSPPLFKL